MFKEYDAFVRNRTWEIVPPTFSHNIVGCKWIFCIKRHFDGSIDRYKTYLVSKGFHQCPSVDYHDTFIPVVKPIWYALFLVLLLVVGGLYDSLIPIMPSYKATFLKMFICHNHKALLILIIHLMYASLKK